MTWPLFLTALAGHDLLRKAPARKLNLRNWYGFLSDSCSPPPADAQAQRVSPLQPAGGGAAEAWRLKEAAALPTTGRPSTRMSWASTTAVVLTI